MKDRCKDCEDRDRCPEVAAGEVGAIGWKLGKMLGESGIKPSFELLVALLGMACAVAKMVRLPKDSLKVVMLRAAERLSDLPAPSEALKDLPPDTQVH